MFTMNLVKVAKGINMQRTRHGVTFEPIGTYTVKLLHGSKTVNDFCLLLPKLRVTKGEEQKKKEFR